jgi:hypothetical protein
MAFFPHAAHTDRGVPRLNEKGFFGPPTDDDTDSIIFPFPTAEELLLKADFGFVGGEGGGENGGGKEKKGNTRSAEKVEPSDRKSKEWKKWDQARQKKADKEKVELQKEVTKKSETWTDDQVGRALNAAIDKASEAAASAAHAATEAAFQLTTQGTVKLLIEEMRPLFEVSTYCIALHGSFCAKLIVTMNRESPRSLP